MSCNFCCKYIQHRPWKRPRSVVPRWQSSVTTPGNRAVGCFPDEQWRPERWTTQWEHSDSVLRIPTVNSYHEMELNHKNLKTVHCTPSFTKLALLSRTTEGISHWMASTELWTVMAQDHFLFQVRKWQFHLFVFYAKFPWCLFESWQKMQKNNKKQQSDCC